MNGKEALERLGAEKLARGELIRNDSKVEPYINCIKKDLDKLEKYKNAVEILKDKKVSTTLLWNSADVNDYNLYQQERYCLSQQEYEILKEVLENDK